MEFALISHLLLDTLTDYSIQLWWPFKPHPSFWASIYIIDPLYSLILIRACLLVWILRKRINSKILLIAGILLSTGYLGLTLVATGYLMDAIGLAGATLFALMVSLSALVGGIWIIRQNMDH